MTKIHRLYPHRFAQNQNVEIDRLLETIPQYNPDTGKMETVTVDTLDDVTIDKSKVVKDLSGPHYELTAGVVDGLRVVTLFDQFNEKVINIESIGGFGIPDSRSGPLEDLEILGINGWINVLLTSDDYPTPGPLSDDDVELARLIIESQYPYSEIPLPSWYERIAARDADVNIIDENDGLSTDHQLSLPEEYPAGEGDADQAHRPGLSGPGGNLPRIEGSKDNDHRGAILAIVPTDEARIDIADALGDDLYEDPGDLHITLVYLGKDLSDDSLSKISACLDAICPEYKPLKCRMQGLGVFDHEDNGGRPFYSSVDAVGLAKLRTDLISIIEDAGIKMEHKYDFTPHMTLGYVKPELIDITEGSPGVEWISDKIILMNGDEHTEFRLGSHDKEAGGFGLDLQDLITPSRGDDFAQSDNQLSENTQEDPDLKLGDVEEPYALDSGPENFRFDDGVDHEKGYNIVKGANKQAQSMLLAQAEDSGIGHIPPLTLNINQWSSTAPIQDGDDTFECGNQCTKWKLNIRASPHSRGVPHITAGIYINVNGAQRRLVWNVTAWTHNSKETALSYLRNLIINHDKALAVYGAAIQFHDEHCGLGSLEEKEAIGIPDNGINPNGYGDNYDRLDSAIPRNPDMEGPSYGR